MSVSSSYPNTEVSLTETTVEQFKRFMKFIGDNNLWDEVEQHLKADGINTIFISNPPIVSIRRLITDKLLNDGERLGRQAHAQALVIARCGCGVSTPGPGPGPVSPVGGGADGGT